MHIAIRHNLQVYDPADPSLREDAAMVLPIREAEAVMGETVAAYLDRVAWRFDLPTICLINGECYGRAEWPTAHLAVNDNVEFVSRPLGGGSAGSTVKSIAAVVALVALTAVAGPAGALGGALAGALGTTLGAVAGAVIVGAGALAISHFLSPKSGGKTDSKDELYSFGLGGNAAHPMQPIPVLNGRLRFAPDYAAPTYSEYDGDRMIDYALYGLTCGRMRVEQLLIGDTPIWDYQTGPNPDFPGIELQIVEPGQQVTLYPVNVVTADEVSGIELSTTYSPGYIVNAAGTLANQLLLDFVWGGGCYRTNDKGKTLPASTHILVRIRVVNAAGAPSGPWVEISGKIYTFAKQTQIRVTERFTVTPGRYEVSVRRVNEPLSADGGLSGQDDVTWTALRAHIEGPQAFPRVTTLAIKGVASKALSGVSGGQLRVIGTRILPVWRDGLFVDEPTRSIAWAALDWWRNGDYAAGLSLSDIDFQAFAAYDALWTSLGHTFDHRFTEVQNLDDVLETVLKAGRAFPSPVGDKLTITRDQPRGLSRMLFTENDILRDSLEIDYALSDEAWADGMVGEYVDESTWRLAEVSSAPDGVTLLKPARIQLQGVVNRTQAAGIVRFMAAESQYRRISVNWTARMEGRLLKRGDLVKITAEEPETWGQSCEIINVADDGLTLTLDPPPVWEASGSHFIEIRRRDGRPWGPVAAYQGSYDAIVQISPSAAASVAGSQGMTLADAIARSPTEEACWVAFSPGQPRTFPVLITEGDPDQDGEHIHLSGVLDAAEVYTTTESGVPPLLQIADLFSSSLPAIIGLTASIVQRQLHLLLTAGWQPARNAVSYVADVSYDGGGTWIRAYEGDRTIFDAIVGGSDAMRVRVAGVTPAGTRGAFYVVAVAAPDIFVDGDQVGIIHLPKIDYDGLNLDLQNRIAHILEVEAEAYKRAKDALDAALAAAGVGAANTAAIIAESQTRLTADEAFATNLTGVVTRLGTAEAGIVTEQTARSTADMAIATSLTTTIARIDNATTGLAAAHAAVVAETSARVTADTAIATNVTTVTSQVNNATTGLPAAHSAIVTEANTRATADTAISNSLTSVISEVRDANTGLVNTRALVVTESSTRATADSSLATGLTEVYARTDAGTATGRFSLQAGSVPSGVSARIQALLSTVRGSATYGAGYYLDLMENGTSRFVIDANAFYITANNSSIPAFSFDGSLLTIPNLRVTNQAFLPNSVSQSDWNLTSATSVSFNLTTRANSRVSITAMFDGQPNTPLPLGSAGRLQIRRNGALIRDTPINFYTAGNNTTSQLTLGTTTFVVDTPGAGTHTYLITNTGNQGPIAFKYEELAA